MINLSCHDLKKEVDLIIFNAKIYTPDSLKPNINCIAVKSGRIFKIGTDAEIRSRYWAPENINASRAVVYPGFIDAHSHFTGYAKNLRNADLSQACSFDEVLEILKGYRLQHPEGWLVGRGWDQNKWKNKKFPENTALDKQFPGVPVVLTRIDGHAVLASDAAIKAAGIVFPGKAGEAIVVNGRFSGIFLENMADKIKDAIPQPTTAEISGLLLTASKFCHEAGLTSVTDAGLNKSEILLLDSLQQAGKLLLRIDAWLNPNEENFDYFLKDKMFETPFLRVGAIKMFADGALGSRGACLLKPYSDDPGNYGLMVTSPSDFSNICKKAYNYGFQINTHAIGDMANRMVLQTYAKLLKEGNDRRWRVEHAQVVDDGDFGLFGKYDIIPSVQATHATSDMGWAESRLGNQRIKNAYAYKRLLDQNGWLPNGTDFPIEGIEPLNTFYAAVARKDREGNPENGFNPENALSRDEALKSITIWAAKASFSEKEKGSIETGKMADFTILDTDLLKAAENELIKAKVVYTVVNGEVVFKGK